MRRTGAPRCDSRGRESGQGGGPTREAKNYGCLTSPSTRRRVSYLTLHMMGRELGHNRRYAGASFGLGKRIGGFCTRRPARSRGARAASRTRSRGGGQTAGEAQHSEAHPGGGEVCEHGVELGVMALLREVPRRRLLDVAVGAG